MRNSGGYAHDGWSWSGRFLLLLVASWTVPLVLVEEVSTCLSYHDCEEHQYCQEGKKPEDQGTCVDCLSCEDEFNRAGKLMKCPVHPLHDCGDCLSGFNYTYVRKWFEHRDTPSLEQSAKCEPNNLLTAEKSAAETEEPETAVAAGTYVGFAVLGMVVGSTVGAAGTICYFRCVKIKAKEKDKKADDKDAEAGTELHELITKPYTNQGELSQKQEQASTEQEPTNGHGMNGSSANGNDQHNHTGV